MAQSIYITTAESHCGKSLICLGIIDYVLRRTRKVTYFKPIIINEGKNFRDRNINLLIEHFGLEQEYEEAYAFNQSDAHALISAGHTDKLLDKIIQKYKALEKKSDFVLIEGTDFVAEGSAFEVGINIHVAKNLGSPVVLIGRGDLGRSIEGMLSPLQLAIESYHEQDYDVVGAIVNRTEPEKVASLLEAMKKGLKSDNLFLSVIPTNRLLKSPNIREIAEHLDAEILYGADQLDNQVYHYSIAAMQLQNYLPKLVDNCMVITPGDRGEIILGTLEANLSVNYPSVSAIVLTAGLQPDPAIRLLLDGSHHLIPILSTQTNTFETATKLDHIHSYITAESTNKIIESLKLFEKYVDMEKLEEKTSKVVVRGMTPRMFQYQLTQKAKSKVKRIVLPEGEDDRILKAAEILSNQDIVKLTLLGKKDEIGKKALRLGITLDESVIEIINPEDYHHFEQYASTLYELRKEKGITLDMARESMLDVSYFGTMMVYQGDADGMVSGAQHTTQHTIRPALQFVKTKKGFSLVSSVFFMCLEDRVLVYADCAINPNPTAEDLAEIAWTSAHTARAFGIEPRVAMLSYSSGESGKGADVEKVREATKIIKSRNPDFKIEGPIQYDAAVDLEVGAKKIPGSEVAGKASVLIFPDLNTGNNTYKAVQRETGAVAIGPVLQGLNKPVNDLSRGCTVTDIVNTVIITAIQAQDQTAK